MQSLYESSFICVSKAQGDEKIKKVYQKRLAEIFQRERKSLAFIIKPYVLIDTQYNTIKSTINFYIKNISDKMIDIKNKENIKAIIDTSKKSFCYKNKSEEFKNISFIDQIGAFYEKTLFFIKYINNIAINNPNYETQIVEVSRCGYNMGEILKNMGYNESDNKSLVGYFYQYKYFPIICFYTRLTNDNHIFLRVMGYYTENTKDEIISEMNKIKEQLSILFYIK